MFKSLRKDVPVVGSPTVHEWSPIVTFTCTCTFGKPLMISAVGQVKVCPGCGDQYTLAQLHFDSAKGSGASMAFHRIAKKKVVD